MLPGDGKKPRNGYRCNVDRLVLARDPERPDVGDLDFIASPQSCAVQPKRQLHSDPPGQALKPGEGIEWGKPQMKRAGPGVESILRGQMLLRRMDVAQAALQG